MRPLEKRNELDGNPKNSLRIRRKEEISLLHLLQTK